MSGFLFDRICIIGVGLIGGSLALSCKKHNLAQTIIGFFRDDKTLKEALDLEVIDEGHTDHESAIKHADLIVIATPLSSYENIAKSISPFIKKGAIITDVGSVKQAPTQRILNALTPSQQEFFVPAHPIAGTEKSGAAAAFDTLYDERLIILTPQLNTSKSALLKTQIMWQSIGAKTEIMKAKHHDLIYASVSHNIQLLSTAFGASLASLNNSSQNEIINASDSNFKKFIRLTGSDEKMWTDIFIENYNNLSPKIEAFLKNIASFIKNIELDEASVIKKRLSSAKKDRLLLHQQLKDHSFTSFRKSDYSNLSETSRIWMEIIPKIISCIVMQGTSESEYNYANGAGFHGLTKNIILDGALDIDDILGNKNQAIDAINSYILNINLLTKAIKSNDSEAIHKIFLSSKEIYGKI